jgi:transcription antitermination factor NusG
MISNTALGSATMRIPLDTADEACPRETSNTPSVRQSFSPRQAGTCSWILPDDLLVRGSLSQIEPRNWWIIYTRSRQEKVLAEHLFCHGVPFYLPLIKRNSFFRGRRRVASLPLFTGYVFLFGSDEERVVALKSNRISTVQRVCDGEHLRTDLLRVADLIAMDAPLTAESRLVPGERVRVKSGPFVGYEGTVLRRAGKVRLFVAVDYLRQGISLEIDDYLLEPI